MISLQSSRVTVHLYDTLLCTGDIDRPDTIDTCQRVTDLILEDLVESLATLLGLDREDGYRDGAVVKLEDDGLLHPIR